MSGSAGPKLGDIRAIPPDRDAFKAALREKIGYDSEGALGVHAGILYRFAHVMKAGDLVVYPSKGDRMVNIGEIKAETAYVPDDPDAYPQHRAVKWLASRPRAEFSQSALNEIGSAMTLFLAAKHAQEFMAAAGLALAPVPSEEAEAEDDDTAMRAVSDLAQETAGDFIIRRLMGGLSGYQFEEFVAHLMECMDYTARVTSKSGDGGVDVIAHLDALGFQPPVIKIQCKRSTAQTGHPDVNQLLGTLGEGEYGLFINLGSYSQAARMQEKSKPKLRLVDGQEFVRMVLENYPRFSPRYRSLIPLKQIFVPDLTS